MAETNNSAEAPKSDATVDQEATEPKARATRKRKTNTRTPSTKSSGSKANTRKSAAKKSESSKSAKQTKTANKTTASKAKTNRRPAAKPKVSAKSTASGTRTRTTKPRKRSKVQYRKILNAELNRVQVELSELRSTFDGEVDIDPEEGDVEVSERTKNISLIQMLETRERQFLDALQSVDSGEYGKCKRCREDINPERLLAIPDAKYCINCQELVERSPTRLF